MVSVALHALALVLIFVPVVATTTVRIDPRTLGLGNSHWGGGGGGNPGAVIPERLRFLQVTPAPPRAPPLAVRAVVPKQIPKPSPPHPPPSLAPAAPAPPTAPAPEPAGTPGASSTEQMGAGPGTGGGAGTGRGTGVGNGVGNGVGGSPNAAKVRAYPIELPAAGLDAPSKIRPVHLEARFEVTDRGDARLLSFTPTRDDGFNKRLREELSGTRFHAAALPDGTPVADTVAVTLDLQ